MLSTSLIKVTDISQLETKWRSLELHCTPSFFLTWTWIGPWAKMVSKNTELYFFCLNEDGTPIAMCFITLCQVKRLKGLITARQIQLNEHLDNGCNMVIQYNGLLAESGNLNKAWKHLLDALLDWNKNWDEIAISSLTAQDVSLLTAAATRFHIKIDKAHPRWIVPLDAKCASEDNMLSRFKGKSRRQLKQSLNAYTKDFGEITLIAAEDLTQALEFFKRMESLHTSRWVQAGKAGSFANPKWVEFHKDVITEGFSRGEIQIVEIHAGETILGYIYGHPYMGTAYMQQTGFTTTQDNRLRPGYVSHLHTMLYNAEKGIQIYDFLPDEPDSYKKFFTSASEPVSWLRLQIPSIKFYAEDFIRYAASRINSLSIRRSNN